MAASTAQNEEAFAGTLYKRGKINRAFKERWFMVSRSTQLMEYYECSEKAGSKSNCLGTIDLALIQKISVMTTNSQYDNDELPAFISYTETSSEKKSFSFSMASPHRTFILAALSEQELLEWLQYLSLCLYGGVIKEDFVKKQEGATALSRAWKRRYCVLNEYHQLKWYKDEHRTKCLGFIDIKTVSSVSNGKEIASELGYILDLYTKYSNVWYIGCRDEDERREWNKHLTLLLPKEPARFVYAQHGHDEKQNEDENANEDVFGGDDCCEVECRAGSKCHSVQRMVKCLHIWNGNGDEMKINEILSSNKHFSEDYEHILSVHLDSRNEFQILYKHVLKHVRQIDLTQNHGLTLPDESKQNTFYVNAMFVIHCYLFGDLV